MTAPTVSRSARFADKVSGVLAARFSRRGFFARSAVVGSAIAVNPVTYALKPGTAYAAVCNCYGSNCECGSLCCDGYTEFCCTLTGRNTCPPGTKLGGWWKADGTGICGGPRYYMDCNAPCNGCGCGGGGICGGECSGTGCGCANGDCNNRKSGCTRFRYGQCNNQIACIGPILCRVVTCVPPWEIEPTCTTTSRTDQNTATHDRACLHVQAGSFEAVAEAAGGVRVTGWALDYDTQGPVTLIVSVDGVLVGQGLANLYRPDIAAAFPGYGSAHGFDFVVPAGGTGGVHQVCVAALNAGYGSGSTFLGCRNVVFGNPFGSLEGVAVGSGNVRVTGWVIDPDSTGPVQVHVYVDGAGAAVATANIPRPDVGAVFPGFGNAHGFDVTVPVTGGTHNVCVYGINIGPNGTANPAIGCRAVEVGLPFGAVDSLIGVSGGAKLSGWVIDPDTAGPIDVHVYVDGVGAAVTTANVTRPDVGALFPTAGSDHGFELTVPMSPGIHSVCTYAINVGGGRNPTIACRTVNVPSSNPFGRVDGVSAVPGGIRVVGWVLDPDSTGPVDVHLYLDGVGAKVITANLTRPDIAAAYPGYGPVHGFDTVVPSAVGWRSLCAYGINTGPGGNSTLGCRNVLVGGDPFGAVDAAIAGSGKIRVTGWAIDPDTGNPIDVHIYVDGAGVAITTANLTRADVGSAFTGYGDDHGFDVTVAATSGTRSVCAYAINTGSGTSNPLLGCRSARVL